MEIQVFVFLSKTWVAIYTSNLFNKNITEKKLHKFLASSFLTKSFIAIYTLGLAGYKYQSLFNIWGVIYTWGPFGYRYQFLVWKIRCECMKNVCNKDYLFSNLVYEIQYISKIWLVIINYNIRYKGIAVYRYLFSYLKY